MQLDSLLSIGIGLLTAALGWGWKQFSSLNRAHGALATRVTRLEVETEQLKEATSKQHDEHERLLARMDEKHQAIMTKLDALTSFSARVEETLRFVDIALRATLTRSEFEQSQKAFEQRISRLEESLGKQ